MLKHKHWLKLRALDKRERRILARKIGMKRIGNKFLNYIYSPPTADEIMRNMERNPQNQKLVEDFLDILPKLKRMDQNRLVSLGHKLRIDISPDEKQPVRKILEQGEVGEIVKKLGVGRVVFFRVLCVIALIVVVVLFEKKISPENLILLCGVGVPLLVAGYIGGMASIVGFFLMFSPEANWKERLIGCWTNNRLDLIFILITYAILNHPAPLILIGLMGGSGSIASVILTFVDKKILDYWHKKHFHKFYYSFITILLVILFYVEFCVIAGKVNDDSKKGIENATVNLVASSESWNFWICDDYLKKKEKKEKKEEDGGGWLYEAIKAANFCSAETDDKGNFFLRLIPEKSLHLEATDGKNSQLKPFSLRDKKIKITIKRKLLDGTWDCNDKEIIFRIDEKNKKMTIEHQKEYPYHPCFEKEDFTSSSYSFIYNCTTGNNNNWEIKGDLSEGDKNKMALTILQKGSREQEYKLNCNKIGYDFGQLQ